MLPKIDGIALYPRNYRVSTGGTLPTKITSDSVRCATNCEVPFDSLLGYCLVCSGNADGDYYHVSVAGEIVKKTGALAPKVLLEQKSLDGMKIGRDGSYRAFWPWPEKTAFSEVKTTYEVRLRLIKGSDAIGGKPEGERPQTPFSITLMPPEKPVVPTAASTG